MAELTLNTYVARRAISVLEDQIDSDQSAMSAGSMKTFEAYREQVGLIRGLRNAIQAVAGAEAEIQKEGSHVS